MHNQRLDLDEVVKRHSIQDVLGLDTKRRWTVCPLPQHAHHNYSPSFSLYWWKGRQLFKCHGNCGLKGDVIDLVGYLRLPDYDRSLQQRLQAAELLEGEPVTIDMPLPQKETPRIAPWAWKEFVPPGKETIEYAASRGLTEETLKRFKIGQYKRQAMTIPIFHAGRLQGIKCRNFHAAPLRYWAIEGSQKGLFGYDEVFFTDQPVFIVKGEIAAMYLLQLGFRACAPTGGEGSYVNEYLHALAFSKNIVIGDNDPDPNTREKMAKYAYQRSVLFSGILRFPPEEFKDIDEWLLDRPEDIAVLQQWINQSK